MTDKTTRGLRDPATVADLKDLLPAFGLEADVTQVALLGTAALHRLHKVISDAEAKENTS
jgi:hypothetical protein